MKFVVIILISVLLCQLIKLILLLHKDRLITFKKLIWEGFWVGKFPSSHASLLTSSLYLVILYTKDLPVILFCIVISLLLIYGLLEDKKRHAILETYFLKSNDTQLRKIVEDGLLREFNGHSVTEIITGIAIGLVTTIVLNYFI